MQDFIRCRSGQKNQRIPAAAGANIGTELGRLTVKGAGGILPVRCLWWCRTSLRTSRTAVFANQSLNAQFLFPPQPPRQASQLGEDGRFYRWWYWTGEPLNPRQQVGCGLVLGRRGPVPQWRFIPDTGAGHVAVKFPIDAPAMAILEAKQVQAVGHSPKLGRP